MNVNDRIQALRSKMESHGFAAYILPSNDPHQSEYVAEHWKSRVWITGFDGSAGTAIVTPDHAGLWTDSRYFIQAEHQLAESEVELHKLSIPHTVEHVDWLVNQIPPNTTIGIDGWLLTKGMYKRLSDALAKKNIKIDYSKDLIAEAWEERPALPKTEVFELNEHYCGASVASKLETIRKQMESKEADMHLICTLDDIAWIYNLRGSDVQCNPVTIAYTLIAKDKSWLFIDEDKISNEIKENLTSNNIFIEPYEAIKNYLSDINSNVKVLADHGTLNMMLYDAIRHTTLIDGHSISTQLKAVKNEVEIKNLKKAMLKDGVALTRLMMWLNEELKSRSVKETVVAQKLIELRKAQGSYYGESFEAIVGYKGNGAIVHYRPEEETCASIEADGILLLDSGGQYFDGTTDITRTFALGTPTEEQKRNYTLVLKGHIGIATLKFPEGTRGNQMEVLARRALWSAGLDYGHGTGHGVGFFLNVHEGPQALGPGATSKYATPFVAGMYTSNEPGYYKTGEYGIRIENLVISTKAEQTEYGQFLEFDTITLFPLELPLIDQAILTREEVDWINAYQDNVFKSLAPLLNEAEVLWLEEKCAKI